MSQPPQIILRLLAFALVFTCASLGFSATSQDYYQAAMGLYNKQDYGQAQKYFQAAIQVDPNNWQAYQGLGMCDYAQGDKSGAKAAFDKSLTLHPDNPQLAHFDENMQTPLSPTQNSAKSPEVSPVIGGGNFGLGLEFGDPGNWGATGKYWLDNQSAFQGAVKLGEGTVLQLQYLWHDYDLIHVSQGALPFYVGIGGDLALGGGSSAVAGCVPVGITYLFQKKSVPIDIFVEVVPTIWLYTGGIQFELYGNIGSRFYF